MGFSTRARLLWIVITAVGAAGMGPQALAAGDPAAKAEAIAAFERLNAVPSYRIRWTSSDGTGIAEIVQPDKRHFAGKSDKGSVEIIEVGVHRGIRYDVPGAPTGWQCSTGRGVSTYFDIDKMRRDTTTQAVRRPDTVIDGTPVHGFADANTGDELYVGIQNGLPRRVIDKQKNVTADFYDFGAPIAITPPPCG
jgi:hypothetical protein